MKKNDQFAKALKALRDTLGMSQPDFAAYVGLRLNVVTDWEQAQTLPSFELFINLLRKLGPHADFLLKALAIQGEMVNIPRPHEDLHIALDNIMQNAPRTVREKWKRDLEKDGHAWAEREPSPQKLVREMDRNSNGGKVKK